MRILVAAGVLALALSPAAAQTFGGYPCTVDCSGHSAGYDWAADKGIEDADDCGGNSNSFIEGCRAWAEEKEAEEESNYDYGADEDSYSEDGEEESPY